MTAGQIQGSILNILSEKFFECFPLRHQAAVTCYSTGRTGIIIICYTVGLSH
jgi:hypothetical protein